MTKPATSKQSKWVHLLDLLLVLLAGLLGYHWWTTDSAVTNDPNAWVDQQIEQWEAEWAETSYAPADYSLKQRLQAIAQEQTTRLEFADTDQWTEHESRLFDSLAENVRVVHVYDMSAQWRTQMESGPQLTGLEQLHSHVQLGPEFFPLLKHMPNLQVLNVPELSLQCSSEDLKPVAEHTMLQLVRIGGRCLNRDCLEMISRNQSIQFLHLMNTSINDEDLTVLKNQTQLQSLYIDDSPVTEDGLWALCDLLPQLHVHWNDLHLTNAGE